jgi:hypothetical protein
VTTWHVEFLLTQGDYIAMTAPEGNSIRLKPWAIAEFLRNCAHLVRAVRELTHIADPYLFTVSLWRCRGVEMFEYNVAPTFPTVDASRWDENDDLLFEPIVAPADERPDTTARRVSDRFWNAFGFLRCPFFDADGRFFIPER